MDEETEAQEEAVFHLPLLQHDRGDEAAREGPTAQPAHSHLTFEQVLSHKEGKGHPQNISKVSKENEEDRKKNENIPSHPG